MVPLMTGLMPACISTSGPDAKYERDGIQYGATSGTFRGRWWNYYERGRSFLEGGFYEEAIADLEQAQGFRGKDQLWARTYGLHLVPEYFPNRELGIAHFYQGEFDKAAAELESSYAQQPSARAAYFLGEARRTLIGQRGGDTGAPTIELGAMNAAAPVGATSVAVKGVARDDTYIQAISVNGVAFDVHVSASEVPFEMRVPLSPGQNSIRVVATDLLGKKAEASLALTADVDGPALSFTTPVVLPGRVEGLLFDPSGVSTMTIGGQAADLAPASDGAVRFEAALSPEQLSPPMTYVCTDVLGNETRGLLPVDALQVSQLHPGSPMLAATPRRVSVAPGITASYLGSQLLALSRAPEEVREVRVEFPGIESDEEYYQEELVVSLDVRAPAPLAEVALGGHPLALVPGQTQCRVSRRVPLDFGENTIAASAADAEGNAADAAATVIRGRTEIELDNAKLQVLFMADQTPPANVNADDLTVVRRALSSNPAVEDRFLEVSRDNLATILTEQEISATLGDPGKLLALRKVVPAEVIFEYKIHRDAASTTLSLVGTGTEGGVLLARYIDATGPTGAELELADLLAERLVQEFPKVKGLVSYWDAPEIGIELGRRQRIREYMKCIVYRMVEGTPRPDGTTRPPRPSKICQGLITGVGEEDSTMDAVPLNEGDSVDDLVIEPNYYVVTK